jgi:hypothetical protein
MDRRAFMRISATASVAAAGGVAPIVGRASAAEEGVKASDAAKDITKSLANYVVKARFEDFPDRVRKEVGRSLLNWMGASQSEARITARWTSRYQPCSRSPDRNRQACSAAGSGWTS